MQNRIVTPCLDGYAIGVNPLDGYVVATSFNSSAIPVHRDTGFSVALSCPSTGSPNGTVKLQACNDVERRENVPDANLTNWFDVASGGNRVVSASVTGPGVYHLTDPECMYRWLRVVYTRSSGSITATVRVHLKADR